MTFYPLMPSPLWTHFFKEHGVNAMKLVLASQNRHKLTEMQAILAKFNVEVILQSELGLDIDVEETGTTFEENSELKARAVLLASGLPAIADDSGLEVDALDGAPGVYSHRFGNKNSDEERCYYLLEKMQDVADAERTARFVSVITCLFPDGTKIVARGSCEGVILHEMRGENGFGYDPLFYVPECQKTFSELSGEEKNAISHRGNALKVFSEKYREMFCDDDK